MAAYTCNAQLRREERMSANVEERVRNIICDQLAVESDKVTPTASFIDDLGADSLDIVELVMTMEEEFDLDIPDEEDRKSTRLNSSHANISYTVICLKKTKARATIVYGT